MSVQLERSQPIYLPAHGAEKIAHPLNYSPLAKKNIYLMTHAQERADYQAMLKDKLSDLKEISAKMQYEVNIKNLTSQIVSTQTIIDELKPKNLILRIIFTILAFLEIHIQLRELENFRDVLINAQNALKEHQKQCSDLIFTYSRLLKNSEVNVHTEIDYEMRLILDSVHTQYQHVIIDGREFTKPTALMTALNTIAPTNPIGTYTFVKLASPVCLPQLLVNAAQDYLNKIYGQNHPYLIERVEEDKVSISIAKDPHNGTFTIGYTGRQRVLDEEGHELFLFDSSIVVHLDAEGTVVDADATYDMDLESLNERTPPFIAFDPNLPLDPPEDDTRYATIPLQIDGAERALRVAKQHSLDAHRQLSRLLIGSESLEPNHRAREEQNQQLVSELEHIKQHAESTQGFPSLRAWIDYQQRSNKQEVFFDAHNKEIQEDFLTKIYRKLGPERIHLLPYISVLFCQTSLALPTVLITKKCRVDDNATMDLARTKQWSVDLDIPEDLTRQVKIIATEWGVINKRTCIEATTTYTFSNDGVVSAETIAT